MKTLLTLFFTVIALFTFGQTDKDFKIYFQSGILQSEMKYDKSCNCNKFTEYFESGKVHSIKSYLQNGLFNTQLDGADIIYFEDGIIEIYYFWKQGAPDGRIYCNYPDGKLAYEKFFTNKFKKGLWKFYNQNGTLRKEQVFVGNKTPWNNNDDYAFNKFYFNNKLA